MPTPPDCLSGDCTTELSNILAPGINMSWPAARLQVENALKTLLSSVGNDGVWTVTSGTLPKDFRATLWPSGLPNATRFPMLIVVEGANVWMAPNNPAYDLGTVPATGGTGTKWLNIYSDLDVQIASQVPYTPSGTYAGLWPATAPTNVQQALDSVARTFAGYTALPKAQVSGSGAANVILQASQNKVTFLTTVDFDALGMWSAANNQFVIPAGQSGEYLITFSGHGYPVNTAVYCAPVVWLRRNSEALSLYVASSYSWVAATEISGGTGSALHKGAFAHIRTLSAGDTLSLWAQSLGTIGQNVTPTQWTFGLTKLN